ncbi:MAG TPA: AAA family ATPase [Solirubrobacteraceae bacterium]|nr:AAA family ATPase [Solirubrobacteraceae bacterium]
MSTASSQTGRAAEGLIEREGELSALEAALARAQAGDGRMICVRGAPGIGKSRLLAAAGERAAERGMQVLRARGHALEARFTFGVARQLFEGPLARATAVQRRRLLNGPAAAAGALLQGDASAAQAGADPHAHGTSHGLYWLTVHLAAQRPLLLAVDDAHWADELSLRFLAHLARRLEGLPVAVILTARRSESSAALDDVLSETGVEMLRPSALSPEGVRRLMNASLPGAAEELTEACARVSGGNPFLLTELVRTMRAERWSLTPGDVARLQDVAPETVARSVLGRLRALPAPAVALGRAAAVLGDVTPLRHAARLAGIEAPAAVRAADALARAEVVTGADPLSFVHPIVQRTIYHDLPAAERAETHLRAARLLGEERADPEAVAEHLLHARSDGSQWVVDALTAAAQAAGARGGQPAARDYLRRALREPPLGACRAEVLVALSAAEAALGDPGALEHLTEALAHTESPRRRAEILSLTGQLLAGKARLKDAAEAFAQALRELGEPAAPDDDLWLDLRARLVLTALYGAGSLDVQAELDGLVSDVQAPRTAGERTLLVALAAARMSAGQDRAEVISLVRRAWDGGRLLAEETADNLSAHAPAALLALAGELEEAEAMLDAGVQEARERGAPIGYATACYFRLHARYRRGRLLEAIADAETVAEAAAEGAAFAGPAAAGIHATALVDRGETEAALVVLRRDEPSPQTRDDPNHAFWYEGYGHVALVRGDARGALGALQECARLTELAGWHNPAALDWRSPAALAHAALGDHLTARALTAENLARTEAFGDPRALGVALRAAGLVAEEAVRGELLARAVASLRDSEAELELARALLELGAHIRRSGARRAALEPLREALHLAGRCHAKALVQRARTELAACGARPRRTALRGPDALTPSERRVAEMAATGMRTREIAQALFVTPKTVEKHIAAAYDKLGVRSRGALAEALSGPATALEQ